ncbi:allantoate amidohydrolase [Altererythrobacter sp. B11]|uniref:allantoate amidohydrolase n=1 Tax=Altererythrobacter sp. B11 TaxID=2060312 RepID=UPI000E5AE63E|nr:allantoate amidohydrolase [Altererythrobacter sp. B11]
MVGDLPAGGGRAVARCDALGVAPYSDMQGGLYRGYLMPAYMAAQQALAGWMEQAGMAAARDPAANLIGRYEGTRPDAPALIIGSHLDSVRDGGRYDGPLGIMLGVECIAALHESGKRMPFPIEVIAFGDEEGSRFPAAMLTSRAVAGTLAADALDLTDAEGVPLANAGVDVATYLQAVREPGSALAYLEAHIEQGPVLEAEGLAVGTVTGIAAQLRYEVRVTGMAGHAGTTSMPLRRDALAGAAEMILLVERLARADESDLVATVGKIAARPGAANVISGQVSFMVDIRSGDPARRDRVAQATLTEFDRIATARGLALASTLIHDLPASPCNGDLMELMDAAIADAGQRPFRLVSGAGHDAMVMAALCPTAMLFVRCRGGISHHPAEHVEPADAETALRVMLGFITRLGENFGRA